MLERFVSGEVSMAMFEQWLYSSTDLEGTLGRDDYLALISFDFRSPHASHDLRHLVIDIYERQRPGSLARDSAQRLAADLIGGTVDFVDAVRGLARLWHEGNEWVPGIFVAIESELDEIPSPEQYHLWDKVALAVKLDEARSIVEHYRAEVVEASKKILHGH